MLKEEAESAKPGLSQVRERRMALSFPRSPLPSPMSGVLKYKQRKRQRFCAFYVRGSRGASPGWLRFGVSLH